MTPEQLALVERSYDAILADGDRFSRRFYERLFERHPESRRLFPEDMAEQRAKLLMELGVLVTTIRHFDSFVARTKELGARHAGYGVRLTDYDHVGEALLGAFAEVLGDGATPALIEAWERAYDLVAETMLEGASAPPSLPRT